MGNSSLTERARSRLSSNVTFISSSGRQSVMGGRRRMSDVDNEATEIEAGVCGSDPITTRGKRIQRIQMLTFPMVPACVLLVHAILRLTSTFSFKTDVQELETKILDLKDVPGIINHLGVERSVVTEYLTGNRSYSWEGGSLEDAVNRTDRYLEELEIWPRSLKSSNTSLPWISDQEKFMLEVTNLRTSARMRVVTPDDTLRFYSELIDALITSMKTVYHQDTRRVLWKTFHTYMLVIKGRENGDLTLFYGQSFFLNNGSLSENWYKAFINHDAVGTERVRHARLVSQYVEQQYQQLFLSQTKVVPALDSLRQSILMKETKGLGEKSASFWAANMTLYMRALQDIEMGLLERILSEASAEIKSANNALSFSLTLVILVIILTPSILFLIDKMILMLQNYALGLSLKGVQIRREKSKSDGLLYQMLPKSVALQLKVMKRTSSETFRSVTIFFSDIAGFTALSSRSTPMQVVDLLNQMYNLFDVTIEGYDVYKVETIGDAYMVASGVPQRNGFRHAGEIAQLSLDLIEGVRAFRIPHMPDEKLRMRIGLHTGPVIAGVVGSKMPRYCLFGETVSYASLMESQGVVMKIHLSAQCKAILDDIGGYIIESRGMVKLKDQGETETETFFLRGRISMGDGRRNTRVSTSGLSSRGRLQ